MIRKFRGPIIPTSCFCLWVVSAWSVSFHDPVSVLWLEEWQPIILYLTDKYCKLCRQLVFLLTNMLTFMASKQWYRNTYTRNVLLCYRVTGSNQLCLELSSQCAAHELDKRTTPNIISWRREVLSFWPYEIIKHISASDREIQAMQLKP